MTGFLDRERILDLFEELSEELRLQRVRVQIYIVGGAAMSLTFSRDRTTDDVDGRIEKGQHFRLTDAVRTVGQRHGLTDTWLNDEAATVMPRAADTRARVLYESPYLVVTGASAEHLLAMKLAAAREADREDIGVLCKHLGLRDPEEAIGIYRELFPGEHLKSAARVALTEAFRNRSAPAGS